MPAPRVQKAASFVGRTRELSVLSRLLGELEEVQTRVCFVAGESGVGKSALLAEFAQKAREDRPDVVVLRGRCYERETVPYKAFDGVIDALARHLRRLPDDDVISLLPQGVEMLAQAFPVLARVPRIRERMARERMVREPADGPHARRRAFAALRSVLQRIGERAPLVIAIDDVHRADVDSLALLE
jgi:predicted ATPase